MGFVAYLYCVIDYTVVVCFAAVREVLRPAHNKETFSLNSVLVVSY